MFRNSIRKIKVWYKEVVTGAPWQKDSHQNDQGCSLENLNYMPKGDQSGCGSNFIGPMKDNTSNRFRIG